MSKNHGWTGLTRLLQAAMAEGMASKKENLPNQDFFQVYAKWAEGGWGAILTGERICRLALEKSSALNFWVRK